MPRSSGFISLLVFSFLTSGCLSLKRNNSYSWLNQPAELALFELGRPAAIISTDSSKMLLYEDIKYWPTQRLKNIPKDSLLVYHGLLELGIADKSIDNLNQGHFNRLVLNHEGTITAYMDAGSSEYRRMKREGDPTHENSSRAIATFIGGTLLITATVLVIAFVALAKALDTEEG